MKRRPRVARANRRRAPHRRPARKLTLEPLEPRLPLAAAGLNDLGMQPDGNLSGKIVYINGGHGYAAANTTTGSWSYGRGLTNGMVEDLGNQDQMTMFADYLFRSGATVVSLRPIGYQPNEVVMDNDDPGVTYTGAWNNSVNPVFFGSAGDTPYRFADASPTETAVATYTPNLPAAGFYPIYSWVHSGSDRTEQLYRINHAGGSTEVKVNHRRVGDGLVYLGTYYFQAGAGGSVQISNRSTEVGRVVIADAIRFGNGMGDTDRGAGISGRPREDELSLYWINWQVSHTQGITFQPFGSSLDMDSNVSVVPRYARFMNREAEGTLSDRVLISFHTNASGGGIPNTRGVLGLYNGNNRATAKTPNQFELADTLGNEVNDDLVAQAGQFEFDWFDSGLVTLDRTDIEFGEINNESIGSEFDATIVEVGYHDNSTDAALLRDPKARDAAARATYQGLTKFFNSIDSGATPLSVLPGRVTQARAETLDADSLTVSWVAPAANSYNGDAPAGYRVYGSTDGYGFDGGTFVPGGGTTSYTFNGLSAAEGAYYFKVVAVNAGGESAASEVVAAIPGDQQRRILIVNGFDRLSASQDPLQTVSGGQASRVRPRLSNSFDYAVQAAAAIEAAALPVVVDTTANEFIIAGAVDLSVYHAVIWLAGEESTADDTFNAAEQTLIANYLGGGGKLFVSGAEIGWDLEAQGGGAAFYNNTLKADYVADDAATYAASGAAGSVFEGISLAFDNGALFYDVNFPDRIAAIGGSTIAVNYTAPGTGGAAVQYAHPSNGSKIVNFGFPFETITTAANRAALMDRVLRYFIPIADFNASGRIDGADFLAWQRGFGTPSGAEPIAGDADGDRNVDADDLAVWRTQFGDAAHVASTTMASAGALALTISNPASYTASRVPVERYTFSPSFMGAISDGGAASPTQFSPYAVHEFDYRPSRPSRVSGGMLDANQPTRPIAESSRSWERFRSQQNLAASAEAEELAAIDGALASFAALSPQFSFP